MTDTGTMTDTKGVMTIFLGRTHKPGGQILSSVVIQEVYEQQASTVTLHTETAPVGATHFYTLPYSDYLDLEPSTLPHPDEKVIEVHPIRD